MPIVFATPVSFSEPVSREDVICKLSQFFEEQIDAKSPESPTANEAVKKAAIERESTSSTFLGRGLAVPHGRTGQLDAIRIAVGFSESGVSWPDSESRAHLILLLGVPAAMVRDYLLLMQKILRWHKDTRALDAAGRVVDPAALFDELRALVG